jgi:ectoine hydroxylase-related dioxygenase (phytanoyl-CoA dioxygenase family)
MNPTSHPGGTSRRPPVWLDAADCRVADLARYIDEGAAWPRPPLAADLVAGIPLYDCESLRRHLHEPGRERALASEWHAVLADGPGVLVLAGAWPDGALLDAVTSRFFETIESEAGSNPGGDHFAKAGANNRIWNALQKLALADPAQFARYYANDMLALVCTAWLGPAYQVTSQVNCVNPGGAAQSPHRDYHLGFCTAEQAMAFPAAVHRMSPALTLQGAVAHVDMPVESGPTLMLPHSQKYEAGYLVTGQAEFADYVGGHFVQLPLRKGDAVFFNPALMHAAGSNRSADIRRIVNLLQVSSAFGRAMESVDRVGMCVALYPALLGALERGELDATAAARAVAASAEGYAFPTNLDLDPPLGGLAPASHQQLMRQALDERWPAERFERALRERVARQLASSP